MPAPPGSTDYERGFRDGVTAAATRIAEFLAKERHKDAQALQHLGEAQAMMQRLMLQTLTPLQEQVRKLRPPA